MSDENIEVDYVIDATHLSWVDEKLVDDLYKFIEDKTGAIVAKDGKKILIGFPSDEKLNKRTIKTYVKRFLYKYELLDRLRVISTGPEEYMIHKLKDVEVKNL